MQVLDPSRRFADVDIASTRLGPGNFELQSRELIDPVVEAPRADHADGADCVGVARRHGRLQVSHVPTDDVAGLEVLTDRQGCPECLSGEEKEACGTERRDQADPTECPTRHTSTPEPITSSHAVSGPA